MKNKTGNKGFTLIELLVVIAIIGILSSIVFANLNNARQKTRDAKRISDMRQIQTALQFFYDDNNGGYISAINADSDANGAPDLVQAGYIATIPIPPLGAGETEYKYAPLGIGCVDYHLGVTLEDENQGILNTDIDATANTEGAIKCPDETTASDKVDFDGTAPKVYDLKP